MAEDMAPLAEALESLRDGGFTVGPQWERAHEIAQAREGDPAYDWLHALCHRIEGDDWNAGYWYRRAGRPVSRETFEQECDAMRTVLIRDR